MKCFFLMLSILLASTAASFADGNCPDLQNQDSPRGMGIKSIKYVVMREWKNIDMDLQILRDGTYVNDSIPVRLTAIGDTVDFPIVHPEAFAGKPGEIIKIKFYFEHNSFLDFKLHVHCDLDPTHTEMYFQYGRNTPLQLFIKWGLPVTQ